MTDQELRRVVTEMLDALKWAETRVLGRLPDKNTMSEGEIAEYLAQLGEKLHYAIELGANAIGSRRGSNGDLLAWREVLSSASRETA